MAHDLFKYGIVPPAYPKPQARARASSAPKKKNAHPELDIQKAVIQYLRKVLPDGLHGAIPVERQAMSRDPMAAARYGMMRKACGILPGTPDAYSFLRPAITILWEFKSAVGRISDVQRAFHDKLQMLGHYVFVVRSIDDVRSALAMCGVHTKETNL